MEDQKENKEGLMMGPLLRAASGRHWKEEFDVLIVGERSGGGQRANKGSGLCVCVRWGGGQPTEHTSL